MLLHLDGAEAVLSRMLVAYMAALVVVRGGRMVCSHIKSVLNTFECSAPRVRLGCTAVHGLAEQYSLD